MGFKDSSKTSIKDFEGYNNWLVALGTYETGPDSSNSYISFYNIITKELRTFDKHNSCMPDFYNEIIEGLWHEPTDSVIYSMSVEYNDTVWISTKESLIRFTPEGCNIYDLPEGKPPLMQIEYDLSSNEILGKSGNVLFIFDIISQTWDSLDLTGTIFNGKFIQLKKQLGNRIYACDDVGYFYLYDGDGVFVPFNLNIYGHDHLGFPIHDFCIDANLGLHLGTDIGLLSNKNILLSVEEKLTSIDEILISPNPAKDYINIQIPVYRNLSDKNMIEIYSVLGEKLISISYVERLDISSLSSGFYIIKVWEFTGKFVKFD